MLDLTKVKKYYEIKWFDGKVLHLPLPTQEMLINVMNLENIDDVEKQMEGLTALLKDILNGNIEGRKFDEKEMSQIDLYIIQTIMEDYIDFVNQQLGE